MAINFIRLTPEEWKGFYRIPVGKVSKFHAKADGSLIFEWRDGGFHFECEAEEDSGVDKLITAVNDLKISKAGQPGGSFIINEFGHVIVPYFGQDGEPPILIGKCDGEIFFENPWDDDSLLSLDTPLSCGDQWELPYIGIKFNLSNKDKIHFIKEDHAGQKKYYLGNNYDELVHNIRKIRPWGGCSFIVNPHGHVIIKKKVGPIWKPYYVCQIDYSKWYDNPLD